MSETTVLISTLFILAVIGGYILLHQRARTGGGWMPIEAQEQVHREKQRPPRLEFVTNVEIRAQSRKVQAVSLNLAIGGMLLKPSATLSVGEPVYVSFEMPNGGAVTMPAVVCRTQRDQAAIKFDVTATQRHIIEHWIEQQMRTA